MPGIFLRLTLIGSTSYKFTISFLLTICGIVILTSSESFYGDSCTISPSGKRDT